MDLFKLLGRKGADANAIRQRNSPEEAKKPEPSNSEFGTVINFLSAVPNASPDANKSHRKGEQSTGNNEADDADGDGSNGHGVAQLQQQQSQDSQASSRSNPAVAQSNAADNDDPDGTKAEDDVDAQLTPSSANTVAPPPNAPQLPGHVFVLFADITKLACDAWVGASGGVIDPRHTHGFPRGSVSRVKKTINGKASRVFGFDPWPNNVPRGYAATIDGTGRGDSRFYIEILEEFIDVALEDLKDKRPLFRRKTHLIAMPLIGSGHGGGRSRTGELVRGLMPLLMEKAQSHGVDFAIVTVEHNIWAAIQAERVKYVNGLENVASANLRPQLIDKALELSEYALAGQLAIFIGAGISVGAGLPLWDQLLAQLAEHAGITDEQKEDFEKMTLYDQARVIQRRLEKRNQSIGRLVAERLTGHRYSVAHALLASLPVNEVITTNYDTLFEEAALLVEEERPISILPHKPVPGAARWLLKMHGCVTKPEDIVLTRRDYIRYAERGAALGGIVQSALLTKHLMFVGFSLSDDNFHRVFDAVLKAAPVNTRHDQRNSALMLVRSQLQAELWDGEVGLTYIQEANEQDYEMADLARKHDILLDLLSTSCTVQGRADFLLNDRFESMLTDPELELKRAIKHMIQNLSEEAKATPAWAVIQSALAKLGTNDQTYAYFRDMIRLHHSYVKLVGPPT